MQTLKNIELAMLDFIQTVFKCDFLDFLMPKITALADNGYIWIALAAGLLIFKKTRREGACVALSLIINLILCNILLKPIIARPRPFGINQTDLLIDAPEDFSFPSGHTSSSFASSSALFANKSIFRVAALIIAVLISFSRLYLYVHYPSDVLGGIIIGWLCGRAAHNILKKFVK